MRFPPPFVRFLFLVVGFFPTAILSASHPPAIDGADSKLTSHWEDAEQKEIFVVAGDDYEIRFGTHPARLISLRVDGTELLGPGGATFLAETKEGLHLVPAPRDVLPNWEVHTGQKSAPAKSSAARMNIWRASPLYWEIHLRDIPFSPVDDPLGALPLRVHLVIHAHPDRVHLEFRSEGSVPEWVGIRLSPLAAETISRESREILTLASVPEAPPLAALLPAPGGQISREGNEIRSPGTAPWFVLRTGNLTFTEELKPLPAEAFFAENGHWTGYNPESGLYVLEMFSRREAFSFDAAHKVPSRRIKTTITSPGSDQPRKITVMARTGLGNLEAGQVTDPHGFPRAVPSFVTKNFDGEFEEPNDSAYGDIFFPLDIGPSTPNEHRVIALFQNWGDHPLKQVSSIRFFNIYWHLSTGLSETTCFTLAWMNLRGTLVSVPDYRPYSGPFLMGQPQHDCYAWPAFLHYETAAGEIRPMYQRTDFYSIAPNLARFTMHFRTSDEAARLAVEVMEIPQTDEMRTFLRLRYDWDQPVTLTGDTRRTFRWLQTFEKYLPKSLLWLSADGSEKTLAIPKDPGPDPRPLLVAEPLAKDAPFAGVHEQKDDYSSMMLITSLSGQLGGKSIEQAFLTSEFTDTNGFYAFVPDTSNLELQAGDWLEATVVLMPHGEVTQPFFKPNRERHHWSESPPRVVNVSVGKKINDFPATVQAREDVARFRVAGGLNTIPIIAEGFSRPAVPLLWRGDLWQDQQIHGGDGYQVDRNPADGTYRFTFVIPIRGTEEHDLTVSLLAVNGAEVLSLRDDNGLPVASFSGEADYLVKSPQIFMPGENIIPPNNGLILSSGRASEIRAVPIRFEPENDTTRLRVISFSPALTELEINGSGGNLTVGHRVPGHTYSVSQNGKMESLAAKTDQLIINIPPGKGIRRISIRQSP